MPQQVFGAFEMLQCAYVSVSYHWMISVIWASQWATLSFLSASSLISSSSCLLELLIFSYLVVSYRNVGGGEHAIKHNIVKCQSLTPGKWTHYTVCIRVVSEHERFRCSCKISVLLKTDFMIQLLHHTRTTCVTHMWGWGPLTWGRLTAHYICGMRKVG